MNATTTHLPGCPAHPARRWHTGACICAPEPPARDAETIDLFPELALGDARPPAPNAVRDGGL